MSDDGPDDTDPDPIVTKSITISELMDGDGARYISFDTEGDPELWDLLGMLEYALHAYRQDVEMFAAATFDDEDD